MRERSISRFDLVVVRPVGPLKIMAMNFVLEDQPYLTRSFLLLNGSIINRAWNRLSDDGGEMLVQLTSEITTSAIFNDWVAQLKVSGVQAVVFPFSHRLGPFAGESQVLQLVKSPGSIRNLLIP